MGNLERIHQRNNIITKNIVDQEEENNREREIWKEGKENDWGNYVQGRIGENRKSKQDHTGNIKEQRNQVKKMRESKEQLKEIRQIWKNRLIEITTEEIREGQNKDNRE